MKRKRIIRPFQIHYYYWGAGKRFAPFGKPSASGCCATLMEAYAGACRHLGRGSVYYKAIIWDRELEKPIAILTRTMGEIHIKEF